MSRWLPSNTSTYYWANGSLISTDRSGTVVAWTDQSGNSRTIGVGSSGTEPTVVSADLNGYDVLEFDGSDDYLVSDDATEFNFSGSDFAIFSVHQRTGGNSSVGAVYDMGDINADAYSLYYVYVPPAVDSFIASVLSNLHTESDAGTEVFCSAIVDNGTTAIARVDGATAGNPAAPDTSYASGVPFTIGATTPTSGFFDGKVAEIVVCQATLSDYEMEQFEGYLRGKYDLSKYPNSHRFEAFAPAFGLHGVHNQDLLGELSLDVEGPLVSDTLAAAI
jgi:hypothetical protein